MRGCAIAHYNPSSFGTIQRQPDLSANRDNLRILYLAKRSSQQCFTENTQFEFK